MFDLYLTCSNRFIGIAGLIHDKNSSESDVELGYILKKEFWGIGYATEACKNLIEFGFSKLNLKRIIASCNKDNYSSIKILKKVGMKLVGPYEGNSIRDLYLLESEDL